MGGVFRRAVVVVYWIALPLALLLCAGSLMAGVLGDAGGNSWLMAAGAGAIAGLIAWRLWLNSRALGRTGPLPSKRRLITVFVPLAALAFAGIGLAGLGLIWLSVGLWLLIGPEAAPFSYQSLASGVALPVSGILLILVGGAMILPLRRSLKPRPRPVDAF
ncbi:MAG: hypothetical protein ACK4VY_07590 [Brevundimonas sp.]